MTTNVGKPSATSQPTKPTQPFILSGSINEKLESDGVVDVERVLWSLVAGTEGHESVGRVGAVHVSTCVVAADRRQLRPVHQRRRQSRRHGIRRPVVFYRQLGCVIRPRLTH